VTTELQQNRYDQLVRRSSGIIGPESKVGEVIPELFPMINVEEPPNELQILGGTRVCFGGGTNAAVAAVAGRFQVFNPANSGHIITVTDFIFSSSASSVVRYGIVNVAIATVSTQRFADTRGVFTALPVGSFNQVNSAALAPATGQYRSLSNTPSGLSDQKGIFVLAPGTGLEVGFALVNVITHCTFHWRERPALESELNL